MHCWSIIRLRRRVVFSGALFGALIASIIMTAIPRVYSSRSVIFVNGMDTNGYVTNKLRDNTCSESNWY
jgi:hypothetical protein